MNYLCDCQKSGSISTWGIWALIYHGISVHHAVPAKPLIRHAPRSVKSTASTIKLRLPTARSAVLKNWSCLAKSLHYLLPTTTTALTMVVLTDSDPSSPTKSQQAWPPPPGPSQPSSQSPQPHYGAVLRSEDAYFAPPPAYAQNSDASAPLLPGPPQKATPRPSVAKRFCSAFCYAIIILIVLSILKGLSSGGFGFDSISRVRFLIMLLWRTLLTFCCHVQDNHPRAEDGHVVSCSDVWSGDYTTVQMNGVFPATIPGYPVFTTSKSYSFPINSSLHYLVARGALSSGVVIVRGSEKADRERIGVEVVVRYHNQQSLNRARICELTKPEGGVGLGIYVSNPGQMVNRGNSTFTV